MSIPSHAPLHTGGSSGSRIGALHIFKICVSSHISEMENKEKVVKMEDATTQRRVNEMDELLRWEEPLR